MLSFFRRIRNFLFSSGQANEPDSPVSRYLFYAIGEIALVVIGILIALQINNWNEGNNTRRLELKLLSEMKSAFLVDMEEYLEPRKNRSERYIKYVDDLLYLIENEVPYHDSLGHKFSVLTAAHDISLSTGAYHSLESIGIQIINEDELRQRIVKLFTKSIPYLQYTYQNNRENVLNFGRPLLRSEFRHSSTYIPVDFEALRKGVVLYNVLKSIKGNNFSIMDALDQVIEEMEEIIKLIDSELEKS